MTRGMIWNFSRHFQTPFSPRKSGFFQRKGRKRVKEWREVTFMKEWVKALYIGYHQELDLPKNLFPFPRTVQLKISLGPIRFLYSKFHGLLKLIFHFFFLGHTQRNIFRLKALHIIGVWDSKIIGTMHFWSIGHLVFSASSSSSRWLQLSRQATSCGKGDLAR